MEEMKNGNSCEGKSNGKNSIGTVVLLVLGSIFIVVAATIFAYKAWPYMNQIKKNFLLIFMIVSFYGLSYMAEKKFRINGTATAFYYLGTILIGLTVKFNIPVDKFYYLVPSKYNLLIVDYLCKQLIILFVLIPMVFYLYKKKRAVETIIVSILLELFVMCIPVEDYYYRIYIGFAIYCMVMFIYHYAKKRQFNRSVCLGLKIVTIFTTAVYGVVGGFFLFFDRFEYYDEEYIYLVINIFVAIFSFVIMYLYYLRYTKRHTMVCTIYYLILVMLALITTRLPEFMIIYRTEFVMIIEILGVVMLGKILDVSFIRKDWVSFVLYTLITADFYYGNCMFYEDLFGCLFLSCIEFGVLLYAIVKKRMKYIIMSSVTLVLIVLYVTRDFWMSINWWIYLLLAGAVMIGIAFYREKIFK